MGHSLKSRSYQARVKNIHHWMSYSTQSDKFGVPVPKQYHVTSITQGRADTGFLPWVGAHYTSKLKNWEKEALSQSSTCRYALCHAYHPVWITWQVLTGSCAGSVEAIESDKLREHSGIWKGTRKNVTDVLCFEANWENMALCEPINLKRPK